MAYGVDSKQPRSGAFPFEWQADFYALINQIAVGFQMQQSDLGRSPFG